MSESEIEDTKHYFEYIEHLCKFFNQLNSHSIPISQNFIKNQHQIPMVQKGTVPFRTIWIPPSA